eukprot:EG_transcript_10988
MTIGLTGLRPKTPGSHQRQTHNVIQAFFHILRVFVGVSAHYVSFDGRRRVEALISSSLRRQNNNIPAFTACQNQFNYIVMITQHNKGNKLKKSIPWNTFELILIFFELIIFGLGSAHAMCGII